MKLSDLSLTCQTCGQPFIWPASLQGWPALPGGATQPALCMKCRVAAAYARTAASTVVPDPPWDGLPLRTTSHRGIPGDPINLAFVGSQAEIIAAFAAIKEVIADPLGIRDDLHLAEAALHHGSYAAAPVSRLFLFGRVEDLAIEHEIGSVAERHHARFWNTGRQDAATQRALWLGAASEDIGIEIVHDGPIPVGTTHRINPDLDLERDTIMVAMVEAGLISALVKRPGIGATDAGRNGEGDPFFTDGDVVVLVLNQVSSTGQRAPTSAGAGTDDRSAAGLQ
jgi:hypothetical protein